MITVIREILKPRFHQSCRLLSSSNGTKSLRPEPTRPLEPDPEECCGQGCQNCVWTLYFDKLAEYEQALAEWKLHQQPEVKQLRRPKNTHGDASNGSD